jgi:hypothetical protein
LLDGGQYPEFRVPLHFLNSCNVSGIYSLNPYDKNETGKSELENTYKQWFNHKKKWGASTTLMSLSFEKY